MLHRAFDAGPEAVVVWRQRAFDRQAPGRPWEGAGVRLWGEGLEGLVSDNGLSGVFI